MNNKQEDIIHEGNRDEEFNLSDKECNIAVQKVNRDFPSDIAKFYGIPRSKEAIIVVPKPKIIVENEQEIVFEKGFFKEDVKEFIRRLKEELNKKECNILTNHIDLNKHIDLITGKDIITLPQEELRFEKGNLKSDILEVIDKLAGEKLIK